MNKKIGIVLILAVIGITDVDGVETWDGEVLKDTSHCNQKQLEKPGADVEHLSTSCNNVCVNVYDYGAGKCTKPAEQSEWRCVCCDPETIGTYKCWGDPHCYTPDSYYWHPMFNGKHVLVRSTPGAEVTDDFPAFKIHADTSRWPYNTSYATFIRSVQLEIFGQVFNITSYPLNSEARRPPRHYHRTVSINGQDITHSLPYRFLNTRGRKFEFVEIFTIGSWMKIFTSSGIRIQNYGTTLVIQMPVTYNYKNKVDGLLGHLNKDGDRSNDLRDPKGNIQTRWTYAFVDTWKSDEFQEPQKGKPIKQHRACTANNQKFVNSVCKKYFTKTNRANPFSACLSANERLAQKAADLMVACEFDSCEAENPEEEVEICEHLSQLASECESAGHKVGNFRSKKFCAAECGDPHAQFKTCLKGAQKTCAKSAQNFQPSFADKECVAGCECRGGYFLNEITGKCVKRKDCPRRR